MRLLCIPAVLLTFAACTEYDLAGTDAPLEPGPICDNGDPEPYLVDTAPCAADPVVGNFEPLVEWTWTDNPVHPGFHQVMAQPIVANLNDDDNDGDIDDHDIPDVLFTAFSGGSYSTAGALVAVSGATGATLWSVMDAGGFLPHASSGVAVADLDHDGHPEVLVTSTTGLLCLDEHGALQWHATIENSGYGMPAVGDLDGDGVGEVVLGRTVVDAQGAVVWVGTGGRGSHLSSYAIDLDGDGLQEVVAGNTVYEYDGTIRWQAAGSDGWTGVADVDSDGAPEIVRTGVGVVDLLDSDGTVLWSTTLSDGKGGPPTIADFDGDGEPEIGIASTQYYRVIESDGTILWENEISDFSSSVTGSSVFDFEGDGAAEVVYADEHTLWIYDGATGAVEMEWTDHSSGTLIEYPVIVDVDLDGSAEIIVASNDYAFSGSRGITVIGDRTSSWAPARPVWNQHAYFITNIDDDGGVPSGPNANTGHWNSFRAGNSETAVGYAQPDLRIGTPEVCRDECSVDQIVTWLPIENGGEVDVGEVFVSMYRVTAEGDSLISTERLEAVAVGETTWIGPIGVHRMEFGAQGLRIRVDDDGLGGWGNAECDEVNNEWWWTAFPCDF